MFQNKLSLGFLFGVLLLCLQTSASANLLERMVVQAVNAHQIYPVVLQGKQAKDASGNDLFVIPVSIQQTKRGSLVKPLPAQVTYADDKASYDDINENHLGAFVFTSMHIGAPQVLSGSLGVIIGSISGSDSSNSDGIAATGLLLQVEPGLSGIQGSIGYAGSVYNSRHLIGWGVSAKINVLQTWNWDIPYDGVEASSTYIGPEFSIVAGFGLNIGGYMKVDKDFYTGASNFKVLRLTLGFGF